MYGEKSIQKFGSDFPCHIIGLSVRWTESYPLGEGSPAESLSVEC